MVGGYAGTVLYVDLSTQSITKKALNMKWGRDYIGGKGLGARYFYEMQRPRVEPFSPENHIVIMTGPCVGTIVPLGSRHVVFTKSPLTGTISDTYCGGHFGAELKFAGYDGIVIWGKALKPCFLLVDDDKVEIRNAEKLWGRGTHYADKQIKEELGDESAKIFVIGPAGEKLVKFACITSDFYRQSGRGGAGAVFGSKNLKAIVVRGTKGIKVERMNELLDICKFFTEKDVLTEANQWSILYGSPYYVDIINEIGILPTRNFQEGVFEDVDKINGNSFKNATKLLYSCFGCPMGCGKFIRIVDGPFASTLVGPDYETIAMGGSNCGIGNLAAIVKFNELCDNLGIDTISTGNVIGFAMELFEKGILNRGDTDGLDLRFGDAVSYLALAERIAKREGFGNVLADGVRIAAEKIGKGAHKYAAHVKGLELPGYDPRGAIGMALAYATSDRGADHIRAWTVDKEVSHLGRYSSKGKAELVIELQNSSSIRWSLIICDYYWPGYSLPGGKEAYGSVEPYKTIAELLHPLTGWKIPIKEMEKIGERIWNLTRVLNVREGFARKDDTMPPKLSDSPILKGPSDGHVVPWEEFNKMLDDYYELRDWNKQGMPTAKKLRELDLEFVLK